MAGKVSFALQDGVATVTIENEDRLNAIDDGVALGLAETIAAAKHRSDIGVLVLRGAGDKAFCAGVDLKYAQASGDRAAAFAYVDGHVAEFCRDMLDMPFPTVAMVRGVCYGGGVQLAVMADFRFADTGLRLAIPAVKAGLFYPIPGLERMMSLMGPTNTKRLLLEGQPIAPEMLLRWGLVDELHEPDELAAATTAFAARLAAQPRNVVHRYLNILRAVESGDSVVAAALRADGKVG